MNRKYTQDEIEAYEGNYDKDDFYILKDGDFFDSYGYYFDKDGFDGTGGYYNDNGVHVKGNYDNYGNEAYGPDENVDQDFADYYDELAGEDDSDVSDGQEEDEENAANEADASLKEKYNIDPNQANEGIRREHCLPAIKWIMD